MTQTPESRRSVTVRSENGLHLGPCSQVAQLAQKFRSSVRISKGELTVDAKSVFDLMILEAGHGTELVLAANGDDADDAVERLAHLFETNFQIGDFSAA